MKNPKIEIDGTKYPFLMGRSALRAFARKKGWSEIKTRDINDMILDMDFNDQDMFHWFCFKSGCSEQGDKFPYSFKEFQQLLDDHPHLVDKIDSVAEEQKPDAPEGELGNLQSKAKS